MTTHPLDPATADEIERAVDLFRTAHGSDAWFSSCGRVEPGKAALKAWQEGNDPLRVIRLLGVDRSGDGGFDRGLRLVIDLVGVLRGVVFFRLLRLAWASSCVSRPSITAASSRFCITA